MCAIDYEPVIAGLIGIRIHPRRTARVDGANDWLGAQRKAAFCLLGVARGTHGERPPSRSAFAGLTKRAPFGLPKLEAVSLSAAATPARYHLGHPRLIQKAACELVDSLRGHVFERFEQVVCTGALPGAFMYVALNAASKCVCAQ